MLLTDKFYEVLKHEGAVSITSFTKEDGAHVTCTWNSYIEVINDDKEEKILIPAAGMHSTQSDVDKNNELILTLASRDVEGFNGYQGTGFRIIGDAEFLEKGDYFEKTHEKYPFANRVLIVKVKEAKQLL